MPKEYAHWTLAEKVYLAIDNPALKSVIAENKGLYRLGAVVPDTPFYSYLGKHRGEFLSAGWRLHGQDGENTLAFIPLLNRAHNLWHDDRQKDPILAFVLGIVTHIIADSQYHPFIYYFSGSPLFPDPQVAQKAAFRHRMIETFLDLHYMQNYSLLCQGNLGDVLRSIDFEKTRLHSLLRDLFFECENFPLPAIKRAVWRHKVIQSKFFQSSYLSILRFADQLPFMNLDDLIALFYPKHRDIPVPFFHRPFRYRHPVSGKQFQQSLPDLEDRVTKVCRGIFSDLESLRREKSSSILVDNLQGPSAYTGLYGSKSEAMIYFEIQDVEKLLLGESEAHN